MTEERDQKSGVSNQEGERMRELLRNAMPRVGDDPEMDRDLWPAMLRRMDESGSRGVTSVPWFDWALAVGLVGFAAIAPHTLPVILYYL